MHIADGERSPEKAGVGGSTPSLATISLNFSQVCESCNDASKDRAAKQAQSRIGS